MYHVQNNQINISNYGFVVFFGGRHSEALSKDQKLSFGVPQGSVGGPTLFSIYLSSIKSILQRHSVKYHCYADDIQLYVSFPPKSNSGTLFHSQS